MLSLNYSSAKLASRFIKGFTERNLEPFTGEILDIKNKMKYEVLITVSGIGDMPELFMPAHDEAPPDALMKSRPHQLSKPTRQIAKAVLSHKAPHSLLFVNRELCEFLGYGLDPDTCGRGPSVHLGTRSARAALAAALQAAADKGTARRGLVVYTRAGPCAPWLATRLPPSSRGRSRGTVSTGGAPCRESTGGAPCRRCRGLGRSRGESARAGQTPMKTTGRSARASCARARAREVDNIRKLSEPAGGRAGGRE